MSGGVGLHAVDLAVLCDGTEPGEGQLLRGVGALLPGQNGRKQGEEEGEDSTPSADADEPWGDAGELSRH